MDCRMLRILRREVGEELVSFSAWKERTEEGSRQAWE